MATFKVGQRVKRARSGPFGVPVGAIGIIAASPGETSFPGFPTVDVAWETPGYERIGIDPRTLEPLTPDSQWADEQIAKLKKLGEVVELTPKQMEEVRG